MSSKPRGFLYIIGPIAVLASVVGVVAYLLFLRQQATDALRLASSGKLQGQIFRVVFLPPFNQPGRAFVMDKPEEVAWFGNSLATVEPAAERPYRNYALVSMRSGAVFGMLLNFLKWGSRRVVIFQPDVYGAGTSPDFYWSPAAPMPPSVARKLKGLWEHQKAFGQYGGF